MRKLFTIQEAAELLGIHSRTVRKLVYTKRLEVVYISRNTPRIPVEAIDKFIAELPRYGEYIPPSER